MANTSSAYDLSRFETQTKEKKTQAEAVKIKRVKSAPKRISRVNPLKAIVLMLLVIAVASSLLYTQVLLTEQISDISEAEEQYTKLEAEGIRLNLALEGKVSLKNVEDYAQTELGMVKKDANNVEYIRLTQENKIEVPEEASQGFWESIKEFFENLLS
ncbi:MAG: hypothetical protein HFJ85_03995 [Oscillospiraceae bacterium]|nr:hypothetical protein [Oscillospiraceae bacterium]